MEIHPPHPVHSFKDFFRELITITAGILIALSLEGLLEWHHHRAIVKEARVNIVSEVRENERELRKEQQDLEQMMREVKEALDLVHKLKANPKAPIHQFRYIWSLAELHSTSWNTAATTGAMSYMDYSEVKKYTGVYDLQHQFEALQQRGFESSLEVEGLATLLERKSTISPAELSDAERRLGIAFANVTAMQQFEVPLEARYNAILKSAGE